MPWPSAYRRTRARGTITFATTTRTPPPADLSPDRPDPRPYAAPAASVALLKATASRKQALIAAGGLTVNVAGSGQPAQNVHASTDPASLVLLQGALALAQANPSQVFQWV